jgi:DNA-binding transcriptional LysR family regulator
VAIKRLEEEFGTQLFAPEGRGIKPLPSAKLLEAQVRVALRALSDARRELSGTSAPRLKFGILPSLSEIWLPRILNAWDGPIEITEALADELSKKLKSGGLDLALTISPPANELAHKVVLREDFMLFVGPAHPFAGRRTIALAELNDQPLVLRQCCELRTGMGQHLFDHAGVRLRVVARTRQENVTASLVASGVGCTFAPKSWQRPGVQAIQVKGLDLQRIIVLAWKLKATALVAAGILEKLDAQRPVQMPAARRA